MGASCISYNLSLDFYLYLDSVLMAMPGPYMPGMLWQCARLNVRVPMNISCKMQINSVPRHQTTRSQTPGSWSPLRLSGLTDSSTKQSYLKRVKCNNHTNLLYFNKVLLVSPRGWSSLYNSKSDLFKNAQECITGNQTNHIQQWPQRIQTDN